MVSVSDAGGGGPLSVMLRALPVDAMKGDERDGRDDGGEERARRRSAARRTAAAEGGERLLLRPRAGTSPARRRRARLGGAEGPPRRAAPREEGGAGDYVAEADDDPLDAAPPSGKVSFLTGRPYTAAYRTLARERWRDLPVYRDKGKLAEVTWSLRERQVTVIVSGTGSGKTVIVPKLVLRQTLSAPGGAGAGEGGRQVAVTNPKSSITLSNAEYAAATLDVELGRGGHVGAAFRGAPPGSSSGGGEDALLFVTDGFLVAQTRDDPTFSRYAAVVIDEAHERTLQIDNLLFMLRRALRVRPELRVVVMSATVDPGTFARYFEAAQASVHVAHLSGDTHFPVESRFLAAPLASVEEVVPEGLRLAGRAIAEGAPGEDILFFVPTARDAERGCEVMREACGSSPADGSSGADGADGAACGRVKCVTLYSKLAKDKQDVARSRTVELPYDRKLIFATNLAESSLTLPSLRTVIDSGLELASTWAPEVHASRLERTMSSQAQMRQRRGRVGRTAPGVCYHLYTRAQMDAQPAYPDPSILTMDLTEEVLAMLRATEGATLSSVCLDYAAYPTPPRAAQVAAAASVLAFYGMLSLEAPAPADREALGECAAQQQRAVHFKDACFREMAAQADLGAVAGMLTGRITTLGRVTLDVMRRCRLGFWNALLVLAGIVYDERRDTLLLAAILEECNGDASVLWQEQGDGRDAQAVVVAHLTDTAGADGVRGERGRRRLELHPRSGHASLLRLHAAVTRDRHKNSGGANGANGANGGRRGRDAADDATRGGGGRGRGGAGEGGTVTARRATATTARGLDYDALLNVAVWEKIRVRHGDMTVRMRGYEIRALRAIVERSPLLSLPHAAGGDGCCSGLDRCVLSARLYHIAVPLPARDRRRASPTPQATVYSTALTLTGLRGTVADALLPAQTGTCCVFESAALTPGSATRFRTVSFYDIVPLQFLLV